MVLTLQCQVRVLLPPRVEGSVPRWKVRAVRAVRVVRAVCGGGAGCTLLPTHAHPPFLVPFLMVVLFLPVATLRPTVEEVEEFFVEGVEEFIVRPFFPFLAR